MWLKTVQAHIHFAAGHRSDKYEHPYHVMKGREMKEIIEEIKAAYVTSGRAFSHNPMSFDERIEAINKWWAAVTPEKVMKLVGVLEKGGYSTPPKGEGTACSGSAASLRKLP